MTASTLHSFLYVHTLSPLHAGTGQSLDAIDLPIARERSTDLSLIPGSSIKGVLRAELRPPVLDRDTHVSLFGPDTDKAHENAGAVVFGDARQLLFPIRSVERMFAWVTSPYVLRRFARDRREGMLAPLIDWDKLWRTKPSQEATEAVVSDLGMLSSDQRIYLEEADFGARQLSEVAELATELGKIVFPDEPAALPERLVIVSDAQLAAFSKHATEIIARIRLDPDKKTTASGALWYEEALPTETILYAPVVYEASRRKEGPCKTAKDHRDALETKAPTSVQLGGKASVGRGLSRLRFEPGQEG